MQNKFSDDMKNVLVTGGAGFIGGALIRNLLINTRMKIFNLDKLGYSSDLTSINLLLNQTKDLNKRYEFLKVDLNNEKEIEEAIKIADPDLVFHLAAESHVDRSIDNPKNFILSNIIGTFNLLNQVRSHWEKLSPNRKNFFKLHHISTDEVFGSLTTKKDLFSEETPYSPRSPYSASKASSDHLVNAWHHTYGLPVIVTNCSNNFGPWQFPEKLIPLVILKALKHESIPVYGRGENIRDWLFVEDHVEAILLLASKAKAGSNYCIGCSQEYKNIDIVRKICQILDKLKPYKKPYSNLISFVEDRPGHDLRYGINPAKIKNHFGWDSKYNFIESLEITVKWYLDNLDWCKKIVSKSGYIGQRLGKKI
tara:strand:+ start:407 stop:1504 length:1098 start_codon:yes stop_codon:yes gene_type:complete